jgi:hypothetical protein
MRAQNEWKDVLHLPNVASVLCINETPTSKAATKRLAFVFELRMSIAVDACIAESGEGASIATVEPYVQLADALARLVPIDGEFCDEGPPASLHICCAAALRTKACLWRHFYSLYRANASDSHRGDLGVARIRDPVSFCNQLLDGSHARVDPRPTLIELMNNYSRGELLIIERNNPFPNKGVYFTLARVAFQGAHWTHSRGNQMPVIIGNHCESTLSLMGCDIFAFVAPATTKGKSKDKAKRKAKRKTKREAKREEACPYHRTPSPQRHADDTNHSKSSIAYQTVL